MIWELEKMKTGERAVIPLPSWWTQLTITQPINTETRTINLISSLSFSHTLSWEPGIFSKQAISPSAPSLRESQHQDDEGISSTTLHVICQISTRWDRHVNLKEKQSQCFQNNVLRIPPLQQRNGTHIHKHNVICFSTRNLFPSIQSEHAICWSQSSYSYSTLIMWKRKKRETARIFTSDD